MNNNDIFDISTSLQDKIAKRWQIVFYKNIVVENVATYMTMYALCMGIVQTMLSELYKHNKSKDSNQSKCMVIMPKTRT